MTVAQEAILFFGAAVLSAGLVYAFRRAAPRLGLLDIANKRSLHTRPTARGGGVAIVVVCVLGLAASAIWGVVPPWPEWLGYLVGAGLVAGVSFLDDVRRLPASLRFAVQAVGAMSVLAGMGLHLGSTTPWNPLPIWVFAGLGILWCVGLTNAYNFMDGIDGLAATNGLVVGLGWALLASLSDQTWLALLALLVAAGCGGFAFHNWHPASIFMGDIGSAFLGFTFAFISLAAPRHIVQFGSGILIIWPFLLDTGFTIVRRLQRRENILVAHRSHLYQRLVLAGWDQAAVTSLYGAFALLSVLLAAAWWLTTSVGVQLFIAAVVMTASSLLWSLVVRAERARAAN